MAEQDSEVLLERESGFYEKNRVKFAKDYPGRFLLIYGEEVIDDFASFDEAAEAGIRKYGIGPFMICRPDESEHLLYNIFR